jgi:hypothetical protein
VEGAMVQNADDQNQDTQNPDENTEFVLIKSGNVWMVLNEI